MYIYKGLAVSVFYSLSFVLHNINTKIESFILELILCSTNYIGVVRNSYFMGFLCNAVEILRNISRGNHYYLE